MPYIPLPSFQIIQEARLYLKSALLIEENARSTGVTDLLMPACVLAGFTMELLLKSFMAKDDSKLAMTVGGVEVYSGALSSKSGHSLNELFSKIDPNWKQAILHTSEQLKPGYPLEKMLKEYADYFFRGRYGYEANSIGVFRIEVLDGAEHLERICTELLPKVYQPDEL